MGTTGTQYPRPATLNKKQSSVSLSTSEAEYIALSLAIQEGKWIHRLLCEILAAANETGPEAQDREDNQSVLQGDARTR
ncbi:hypothetical protein Pcac1_g29327 [Phytophthora cactorum]|nr:hypothetical protein Pcac1_g29327 [Phytophthora cactorum]